MYDLMMRCLDIVMAAQIVLMAAAGLRRVSEVFDTPPANPKLFRRPLYARICMLVFSAALFLFAVFCVASGHLLNGIVSGAMGTLWLLDTYCYRIEFSNEGIEIDGLTGYRLIRWHELSRARKARVGEARIVRLELLDGTHVNLSEPFDYDRLCDEDWILNSADLDTRDQFVAWINREAGQQRILRQKQQNIVDRVLMPDFCLTESSISQ
jgi:hypothetical protein